MKNILKQPLEHLVSTVPWLLVPPGGQTDDGGGDGNLVPNFVPSQAVSRLCEKPTLNVKVLGQGLQSCLS